MDQIQAYLKTKVIFFTSIATVSLVCLAYVCSIYYNMFLVQQTKARQLAGYLSEKELELIKERKEFNLAKSKLIASNKDLTKEADAQRRKYTSLSTEFDSFVTEHNLKVTQYDKRIYSLKQKIKSTSNLPPVVQTIVKEGKCEDKTIVEYSYEDPYGRVSLRTPNCLKAGGEELLLNQKFFIYGEVYKQVNGALKVSSLTLSELNPNDINHVIKTADLVNSEFKYTSEETIEKDYSFTFGAGFDSNFNTNINVGYNTFSFRSLTLNLAVNYIHKQTVHPSVKLVYTPTILGRKTNFGLSGGLGYAFDNAGFFILGVDFGAW